MQNQLATHQNDSLMIKEKLELEPANEERLGLLNIYCWFSAENFDEAQREIEHMKINIRNAWERQAEMNYKELLDIWNYDRMEHNASLLRVINGSSRPEIYRVERNLSKNFTMPLDKDFNIRVTPIEGSIKRVPARFSYMVDDLKRIGGGFDRYFIAEPVRKPQVRISNRLQGDPWLLGTCGSYIMIIGGWK